MTGIDWKTAARRGQLTEVFYLFACRLAWRRHADSKAHDQLVRASQCGNPELRTIALALLNSSAESVPAGLAKDGRSQRNASERMYR